MTNTPCPKCNGLLNQTRLDDNKSYQWVSAIHCLNCGYYVYPLATEYEIRTNRVLHNNVRTWRFNTDEPVEKPMSASA
jgi:hypothetical protein